MKTYQKTKLIRDAAFLVEVDVDLIVTDNGWSPYLSKEDAIKLDDVRKALGRGDLMSAAKMARVFTLTPVIG